MADRSYIFLIGNIENILVNDDKFILLSDFIVIDIVEDKNVPLIIGILFLTTGHTIIDVATREKIMMVYNEFVMIMVFELSDCLEDIMEILEDVQCEDSKCVSYFTLMAVKRKKKR